MLKRLLSVLTASVIVPSAAYAQAALAGVVTDSSGAVVPGVTVEAASNVLIEKVRSAITDGAGQYQIIDLRPGTYVVTFSLTGFASVRRESLELTGTATTTANAEMTVGAISQMITVKAETLVVDIRNATSGPAAPPTSWSARAKETPGMSTPSENVLREVGTAPMSSRSTAC